jgi:hypothetical protein
MKPNPEITALLHVHSCYSSPVIAWKHLKSPLVVYLYDLLSVTSGLISFKDTKWWLLIPLLGLQKRKSYTELLDIENGVAVRSLEFGSLSETAALWARCDKGHCRGSGCNGLSIFLALSTTWHSLNASELGHKKLTIQTEMMWQSAMTCFHFTVRCSTLMSQRVSAFCTDRVLSTFRNSSPLTLTGSTSVLVWLNSRNFLILSHVWDWFVLCEL